MPEISNWMPFIRRAYKIDAGTWHEQGLEIVRIGGGGNNALIKETHEDVSYALLNVYGFWLKSIIPDGEKIYIRLLRLVEACNQYFRKIELDPGRKSVNRIASALRIYRLIHLYSGIVWSDI